MTHCTFCNEYSALNNSFTRDGECVIKCGDSQLYSQDKLCLDECKNDHGIDPLNSKLCVKGCFRAFDSDTLCKTEQSCDLVTEANKYICSNNATCNYNMILINDTYVKQWNGECTVTNAISDVSNLCDMKCGVDAASAQPYIMPGFGCVSDCYAQQGGYYPIIEDPKDRSRLMCSTSVTCNPNNTADFSTYN